MNFFQKNKKKPASKANDEIRHQYLPERAKLPQAGSVTR